MKCPACGAENPDGKEFCGDCGGQLPEEPAMDAGAATPAEVPEPSAATTAEQFAPVPPQSAATPPVTPGYDQAAYQAPAAQPYTPPQPQYAVAPPPAEPPKKKLTGPIIAVIAGVILLCALGCCITLFLLPDKDTETTDKKDDKKIVVEAEDGRGKIEISEEQGFADPMDALTDVADQYYRGADWWYVEIAIEDEYEEYYITPDEATYDKGVILEKRGDEWFVTDVYTVDMSQVAIEEGTEEPATDPSALTAEESAAWTVNELLLAIMEGRIDDAYTFTTTPLYDYDLSALTDQYTDWEFLGAEIQEDGSAVVLFTMYWSDGTTENVGALLVVGEEGWYVSDMGSADE